LSLPPIYLDRLSVLEFGFALGASDRELDEHFGNRVGVDRCTSLHPGAQPTGWLLGLPI
jgi:hypothetical protein